MGKDRSTAGPRLGSTQPDRAALAFAPERWQAFTRRVKNGQAELA